MGYVGRGWRWNFYFWEMDGVGTWNNKNPALFPYLSPLSFVCSNKKFDHLINWQSSELTPMKKYKII